MRTPIVVGNWKMNTSAAEASALAGAVGEIARAHAGTVEVGVAPPTVWLERVVEAGGEGLAVFGQNANEHASGAHTGESAAAMLVDAGMRGVILGHSERRHVYGETGLRIAAKVVAARAAGLAVILCVGEQLQDRDDGETWAVVRDQLSGGLAGVDTCEGVVIAYEPVWAIGTGRTATPAQAQAVHAQIRGWLSAEYGTAGSDVRIQYGGSVKPGNAAELLSMPDIDGALVGGASLKAESFAAIVAAAAGG